MFARCDKCRWVRSRTTKEEGESVIVLTTFHSCNNPASPLYRRQVACNERHDECFEAKPKRQKK